jgi:hypothetical protein
MRRFCRTAALAAAASAVMAAAPAFTQTALAQPAPPPGGPPAASDDRGPPGGPAGGPPPWARGGHGRDHHHGPRMGGPMGPRGPLSGLVMNRDNKQLTAEEATKIAEGFLLWMGERNWKIANAVQQDDVIAFDLTTAEGSRIARFTMDRRTGRVQRVG